MILSEARPDRKAPEASQRMRKCRRHASLSHPLRKVPPGILWGGWQAVYSSAPQQVPLPDTFLRVSDCVFLFCFLRFSIDAVMSLRPSARTAVRPSRYKVAVDAEEGRRRREDNMVEIRKNKREENLIKKHREGLQPQEFQPSVSAPQLHRKLESIPAMVAGVYSNDGALQLEATTQFRKLLSIGGVLELQRKILIHNSFPGE